MWRDFHALSIFNTKILNYSPNIEWINSISNNLYNNLSLVLSIKKGYLLKSKYPKISGDAGNRTLVQTRN